MIKDMALTVLEVQSVPGGQVDRKLQLDSS